MSVADFGAIFYLSITTFAFWGIGYYMNKAERLERRLQERRLHQLVTRLRLRGRR